LILWSDCYYKNYIRKSTFGNSFSLLLLLSCSGILRRITYPLVTFVRTWSNMSIKISKETSKIHLHSQQYFRTKKIYIRVSQVRFLKYIQSLDIYCIITMHTLPNYFRMMYTTVCKKTQHKILYLSKVLQQTRRISDIR